MPRIQFHWQYISGDLREIIANAMGLPSEAPAAFEARFGKRPTVRFVAECWPYLYNYWVAIDIDDARAIAHTLRDARYGNLQLTDVLEYINSCVTADKFTTIILNAFLVKGEQPSDSVRLPTPAFAREPVYTKKLQRALATQDPFVIFHGYIADILRTHCAPSQLTMSDDGEFMIAAGSSMVHVHLQSSPLIVRVHAILVTDITPSLALYESLNSINIELPIGRMFYQNSNILIESSLLDSTFNDVSLINIVNNVAHIADFYDDRLQHTFGGTLSRIIPSKDQIDV